MIKTTAYISQLIFSSMVRDLGVTLDHEVTFAPHLNSLSRSSHYQLRQLRTVAHSLTPTATTTLLHSFVATRLDYGTRSCMSLSQHWPPDYTAKLPGSRSALCSPSYWSHTKI